MMSKLPPALNARPRPVSTTTRASGSSASASQTDARPECSSSLIALSWSGRFSSISRTGPTAVTKRSVISTAISHHRTSQ